MGLSSLPTPSEGMLSIVLVNTALSISLVKGIVLWLLRSMGIRVRSEPPSPSMDEVEDVAEIPERYFYSKEFVINAETTLFNQICGCKGEDNECSVCLVAFEPESQISRPSCGHLFHKLCLEKWLDYWNSTCPLCRLHLIPEADTPCSW